MARLLLAILVLTMLGRAAPSAETWLERTTELVKRPLYERASAWRCMVTSKLNCLEGRCEPGTISKGRQWVELDFTKDTYRRCDAKGCDTYRTKPKWGGAFTTVELPGRATFIKVVNDGSSFVDVATVGVGVVLSFGACTRR